MRKTNLIIVSVLLLLSLTFYSSVAYEQQVLSQSGTGSNVPFGYNTFYASAWQTFNLTRNIQLTKVEVWTLKEGAPTDSVFMSIFSVDSSGAPNQSLYNSTISYNQNNFTGSYAPLNFTFNNVSLTSGWYAIVLNTTQATNDPNFWRMEYGSTGSNVTGYLRSTDQTWQTTDATATGHYNLFESIINTSYFQVTALNGFNGSSILNFSVLMNGTRYNTSNGTIITTFNSTIGDLYNLTASSAEGFGYYNATTTNYNISLSGNLIVTLTPLYTFNVTITNYTSYGTINYTRVLNINSLYSCPSWSNASVSLWINYVVNTSTTGTCNNSTQTLTQQYAHGSEGIYRFNMSINYDNNKYISSKNLSFTSDLYNPTLNLTLRLNSSGFVPLVLNSTIRCYDTIINQTYINGTLNTNQLYSDNRTINNTISNMTVGLNGQNRLYAYCNDLFGNTTSTYNDSWVNTNLILIDERNNTLFDVNNLSAVIAYLDDNSTSYNFKTAGGSSVNFSSYNTTKLRLELTYASGTIIQRWLDPSLGSNNLRICANREGVQHYEQIIYSASQRPIQIQSLYANCTVAQDYTRFAYTTSNSLKFYTTTMQYYLYKFVTGGKTYIASLEGTIQTPYNFDALEYALNPFDITSTGDALVFERANNTLYVLYRDDLAETTGARITILNTNTSTTVYDSSTFADYNHIVIPLTISSLNYTSTDIFKITMIKTTASGTETIKRYFNIQGDSGILSSGMALIFSVALLLFGLTFVSLSATFGWFGSFMVLGAIFVLSMCIGAWYITLMMGVEAIILIFIVVFSWVRTGAGGLI
ncbi:MAG: hypothetical protein [Siphoviridae sp. ctjeG17]|nr:MAG: hypothetical protein [Siphoviridae sp. ctjeG17]